MECLQPGSLEQHMVGVNFKQNPSLSERYSDYLVASPLTCPSGLLLSSPSCLVAKVAVPLDSLSALTSLSTRHGFSRCSGRLFAMTHLSPARAAFLDQLDHLPRNTTVRTHAHPASLSAEILDHIDASPGLKARGVSSSPTQFCTLLVAVELGKGEVGWGVYSLQQYRDTIARPGDGDPLPEFELNFNRAELKLAEAAQLLTLQEREVVFPTSGAALLAVDVGAAPGGWTRHLSSLPGTSVLAIDPAVLAGEVVDRGNVRHLRQKAQQVAGAGLEAAGLDLVGEDWRPAYRLLVCDANMDVRDCLRELVLPLTEELRPGGVLILTLKLGRRVGVEGVRRKVDAAKELLEGAGFLPSSLRVDWLFGNSRNERTVLATKG